MYSIVLGGLVILAFGLVALYLAKKMVMSVSGFGSLIMLGFLSTADGAF